MIRQDLRGLIALRIRRRVLYDVINPRTGEKRLVHLKQNLKVGDMCGIGKRKYFAYRYYLIITKVDDDIIEAVGSYGFERYLLKKVGD